MYTVCFGHVGMLVAAYPRNVWLFRSAHNANYNTDENGSHFRGTVANGFIACLCWDYRAGKYALHIYKQSTSTMSEQLPTMVACQRELTQPMPERMHQNILQWHGVPKENTKNYVPAAVARTPTSRAWNLRLITEAWRCAERWLGSRRFRKILL